MTFRGEMGKLPDKTLKGSKKLRAKESDGWLRHQEMAHPLISPSQGNGTK